MQAEPNSIYNLTRIKQLCLGIVKIIVIYLSRYNRLLKYPRLVPRTRFLDWAPKLGFFLVPKLSVAIAFALASEDLQFSLFR